MSDERPVLDLDHVEPNEGPRPAPVRLREVRAPLWIVALVALGVAVVAVGLTRAWDTDRAWQAQRAAVRLLVVLPPDSGLSGDGDGLDAVLNGYLQVSNLGPMSIALGRATGTSASVTVSGDGEGRPLPVGSSVALKVQVRTDCRDWQPNDPVAVTLVVTTADGVGRSKVSQLTLTDTQWAGSIQAVCSGILARLA